MSKKKIVIIAVITLAILLTILLLGGSAPSVPHSTVNRTACVSCHGPDGEKPYPEGHARKELTNDDCTGCHEATAAIN